MISLVVSCSSKTLELTAYGTVSFEHWRSLSCSRNTLPLLEPEYILSLSPDSIIRSYFNMGKFFRNHTTLFLEAENYYCSVHFLLFSFRLFDDVSRHRHVTYHFKKIFNSLLSFFLTISIFYIHTRYLDSWPLSTGVTFIHSSFLPLLYFHLQINNERLLVSSHFHYEDFKATKHWALCCNFLSQFWSNKMFFPS